MKVIPENYSMVISMLKDFKSSDYLPLECANCGKHMSKQKFRVQAAIKNTKSLYCTAKCASKTREVDRVTRHCTKCGKEVTRRQKELSENVFCSSSCSAAYNNTVAPKREKGIHYVKGKKVPALDSYEREKTKSCKCGKLILPKSETCVDCRLNSMKEKADADYLSKTFRDFKEAANNVSHIYYVLIRTGSRRTAARRGMEKVCKVCGYDIYAELCHINPISSFCDSATMEEINHPDNLVYLCPNHHKELDLGLLKL